MVYQVKTVNGQKTKIPLSGSVPTGNPIGTIISTYKKIQPKNYLYCDGSFFDEDQYPALYLYLGSNQLPDYRECVQVGAEQNTTDTITDHDVYTQGQFKDDQFQDHTHGIYVNNTRMPTAPYSNAISGANYRALVSTSGSDNLYAKDTLEGRGGTTTHGKQKAVYYYIKAVDGVDISDEDTFLNTVKDYVANQTELIWTNSNPTSSFPAETFTSQTLGIDLSQYKAIEVYVKNVAAGGNYSYSKIYKGMTVSASAPAGTISARNVTFNNNNEIAVGDAYNYATYGGSSTVNNAHIIPITIYGVK